LTATACKVHASSESRSRSAMDAVFPLRVDGAQQACAHSVAAGVPAAPALDQFGLAVQRLTSDTAEDLTQAGHPAAAQFERPPSGDRASRSPSRPA
jgi:hypothetical protein